jgi:hypothetical protein
MATPDTGALIGTPASINAKVEPQTDPMEVEPLEDNASDNADGVWEGFFGWEDWFERTLCQRSMTDLAPALSAKHFDLAGGERRETIVVHITFVFIGR